MIIFFIGVTLRAKMASFSSGKHQPRQMLGIGNAELKNSACVPIYVKAKNNVIHSEAVVSP